MRRMGGGPQGVLSVGKAKVKIYAEKEIGVSFADVAGIDEAKAELEEIVEFLKEPGKISEARREDSKGCSACSARLERERPCLLAPLREKPACLSSA